jgi:N12 class adenine-specific DNA methylase
MAKPTNATATVTTSWLPGFEPAARVELPSTWTALFEQSATTALPRAGQVTNPPTQPASTVDGEEIVSIRAPSTWRVSLASNDNAQTKVDRALWPELTSEHLSNLRGLVTKFDANMAAIDTLASLEREDHGSEPGRSAPSPIESQRQQLLRFTGWGGIPAAFNLQTRDTHWLARAQALKDKLSEADYAAGRASVNNSHYTEVHVIQAIWQAAYRLGFRGGRVLEPAAGIGHFVGTMPSALARESEVTAIELDAIAGRILKTLYSPFGVNVLVSPFEQVALPQNWFDLAIGNVPFGHYPALDTSGKPYARFSIHDYFLGRCLDLVRPGGLVCFITSCSTMDSDTETSRAYLASQAELLGAIRLPSGTFSELASTDTQADVLFLRKLKPGQRTDKSWLSIASVPEVLRHPTLKVNFCEINNWYVQRPEFFIGQVTRQSNGHQMVPTATFEGDLKAALIERVALLPEQSPAQAATSVNPSTRGSASTEPLASTQVGLSAASFGAKPGSFQVHQGRIHRVEVGGMLGGAQVGLVLRDIHAQIKATQIQRIAGSCRIRDCARALIDAQLQDCGDGELREKRVLLNAAYDRFVARHGCLSNRANALAFRRDPDYPLLLSLEFYNEETGTARKAALFTQRTLRRVASPTSVADPNEALAASMQWRGRVDPAYMAELLASPVQEVLDFLLDNGQIYKDPARKDQGHGSWCTADEYLSGPVRQKLQEAKLAGQGYRRNVDALTSVQPEDLPPDSIEVRLGAIWIPAFDVEAFVHEVLEVKDCQVAYSPMAGSWSVQFAAYSARQNIKVTQEFGTSRMNAMELLLCALNVQVPTVRDPLPDSDRYRINPQETLAAREKLGQIKERFASWAFEDINRRERLCRIYNDTFNATRPRRFDGSHLKLPGFSRCFELHPHQLDSVWRIVQKGNVGLFHVVGAGKTAVCVMASMEMRRLGFLSKPCHVVPNHMLASYTAEFVRLYPQASVLMATKEDMDGDRRRELVSRIATGDWDAVVITHSSFERIRMSLDFTKGYIDTIIEEIEMAIRATKNGDRSNRIIKQLELMKKSWTARLERLRAEHKKDNVLTWEQLGIDGLFVDEAHLFKNLYRYTKMTRVAGLPLSNSERAFDMYLKTRYTMQLHAPAQRGVVFATATPVANTMAEIHTMQRYLQPRRLEELGLQQFDAWAATFGESVTALEISPDGSGYRMHTRFARFINVPELMRVFGEVADIRTAEMLKLPVPRLRGGKPRTVSCPASSALKDFVQTLVARAQAIREGKVTPQEDNMLAITNDGRAAALDFRLVAPWFKFDPEGKVAACVREVLDIWHRTAETAAAQLVFCDQSSPKGGKAFSVYEDLKQRLIDAGIPSQQIAFIHDADTDSQKAVLFQAVREGRVRVLLGSTGKMGIGTNVQKRLVALHHLDAPWRPCDVEQREGRILRQGNECEEVEIIRYVTERSFDSYSWQTLETKARFIAQVMKGDEGIRSLEDVELAALSYAEVKALASGNPLVIEKAGVDAEVAKLSALFSVWRNQRWSNESEVAHLPSMIEATEKRLALSALDVATVTRESAEELSIELNRRRFAGDEAVGDALRELVKRTHEESHLLRNSSQTIERIVGRCAGMGLGVCTSWEDAWPTLYLAGHCRYSVDPYQTGPALVSGLRKALASVPEVQEQTAERLRTYKKRLEDLRSGLNRPFEHENKLTDLLVRQRELLKALDLDKDEAGSAAVEEQAEPMAA